MPENEAGGAGMMSESVAWDGRVLPEHEPWNAGMVPENEARMFMFFVFLVYSVLAGGVPIKVELVEELGPVSVVRSGTADLRQNVVHPLTSPV